MMGLVAVVVALVILVFFGIGYGSAGSSFRYAPGTVQARSQRAQG